MRDLPEGVQQVNTFSQTDQRNSQVTELEGGGYVVVWRDTGNFDPSETGVRAQIFDDNDDPVGNEIVVDLPNNAAILEDPVVTALAGGGFVIGWGSYPNAIVGTPPFVSLQVYSAAGEEVGAPVRIASSVRYITDIALAPTADGGFLAVWMDSDTDITNKENGDVRAQFFNADGTAQGSAFRVNTQSDIDITEPEITPLSNGNFLIYWQDPGQASDNSPDLTIRAQIIGPDGADVGGEFRPIRNADGVNHNPEFAPLPDGGFAGVWVDNGVPDGPEGVVKTRVFAADGTPESTVSEVWNTLVATNVVLITPLRDGFYAIGLSSTNSDTLLGEFMVFVYDSDGQPVGGPIVVTGIEDSFDRYFDIAAREGEQVLVTWTASNPDEASANSSDHDIYIRTLDLGANEFGSDADEALEGTAFDDDLSGGGGDDQVSGGAGDDTLSGGSGSDTVKGNSGNDKILGGDDRDTLAGGTGEDTLSGGTGDDSLVGQRGQDTLNGGGGDDRLKGGGDDDKLNGGSGEDFLKGGTSDDTVKGGSGADNLNGNADEDVLNGGGGHDRLKGGGEDDRLNGGSGDDLLKGGSGNDQINGGAGDDLMSGDAGADLFIFASGDGDDTISDFDASDDAEQIDLSGVTAIKSFNDLSNNHMTQVGSDVLIDTGNGHSIRLEDVRLSDLDAADFIF